MSLSTTIFTPVTDRPIVLGPLVPGAVEHLADLFTSEQLDTAMDRAARASHATVAVFAAAPVNCRDQKSQDGASAAVEFVVEFFVPPSSMDLFHRELESQLLQASTPYVDGRYRGEFAACVLHSILVGTFHQYRITCRTSAAEQRQVRWSRDRILLDGILHQARTGWRELGQ